jgi:hypothetical protein
MSKHTPGPWRTSGGRYIGISAKINGVWRQIGRAEECGHLIPDEVVEANGCLMAAAPELLAHASLGLNSEEVAMLRRAESVIAKAEPK